MASAQDERDRRYRDAIARLEELRVRVQRQYDDLHARQRQLLEEAVKRRDERLAAAARDAINGTGGGSDT